jgi:PAS domain-containing protein
MHKPTTIEPNEFSKLRLEAEARLKEGSAPPTKGWPTGGNALFLLYKLASTPESAPDALKLLHELQVHQVELDLQHEQMEITLLELSADLTELTRYKGLYEFAPAGYFSVSHQGDIIEGNLAGAALFGVTQNEWHGRRIDDFLAPESRPVFLELLQRLRDGDASNGCEVLSGGEANATRRLQIAASVTPGGGSFLMVFSECDRPQAA